MNCYQGIDDRIVKYVRKYARILNRKIFDKTVEDFEQELMLHVYKNISKFNSAHGSFEHFLIRILSCTLKNIIKYQKRHFISTTSRVDIESVTTIDSYKDTIIESKIDKFSNKYRLILTLLKEHPIQDIAKIMHVSKSTIYRDLSTMQRYFKNDGSCCDLNYLLWRKLKMKEIREVERLSVKELSELPVYDLSDLNEQVLKLIVHTKEIKEKFEDALNLRFSETVRNNLRSENRDTGTTKFIENGFQIIAEVPKKVTWDSEKIDVIIKNISEVKRKNIIKTTHVIDERKYQQLTPEDQRIFADARTVTPGKTKFKITIPNSEEV